MNNIEQFQELLGLITDIYKEGHINKYKNIRNLVLNSGITLEELRIACFNYFAGGASKPRMIQEQWFRQRPEIYSMLQELFGIIAFPDIN